MMWEPTTRRSWLKTRSPTITRYAPSPRCGLAHPVTMCPTCDPPPQSAEWRTYRNKRPNFAISGLFSYGRDSVLIMRRRRRPVFLRDRKDTACGAVAGPCVISTRRLRYWALRGEAARRACYASPSRTVCCSRHRAAGCDSFMRLAMASTAESSAAHQSESSRTRCRMFA